MHLMVLLHDEGLVELCSVRLEIVLILTQDRCMVCTECTMAYKSFWTHPMELVSDVGRVESHFSLFKDNFSVSAR
jgi:Fe-S-cluster-containing dehydrogenase component